MDENILAPEPKKLDVGTGAGIGYKNSGCL